MASSISAVVSFWRTTPREVVSAIWISALCVARAGSIVPKSLARGARRRIFGSAAGGSVAASIGSSVATCVGSDGSSVAGAEVAGACGAQEAMSRTKMVIKLRAKNLFDMVVFSFSRLCN
jgi:hypothetical protein